MANLPGSIATSRGTYTILSDLSLLSNYHGMWEKFIEKYPKLSSQNYLIEQGAKGAFRETESNTRVFNHWEAKGKHLPRIQSTAGSTGGGAGQAVTITLTTNSHEQSSTTPGTYSPVEAGMTYVNNRNGQYYQVTAVNKSVANAHTATLRPYLTTDTIVILATDDLLFHGYVNVEEASGRKKSVFEVDERIFGNCVIIRDDAVYSDLNIMEKIEEPGEYYRLIHEPRIVDRFWGELELQTMFGPKSTNLDTTLGMNAANPVGVIPQVAARGQVYSTATAVNDAFFDELARRIDAEGYCNEFDYLVDTELNIKITNYLKTNYTNGAVLDASDAKAQLPMDVARLYKSYSIHGKKFNMKQYAYFNAQQTWGAAQATGQYSNYGLLIPQGMYMDGASQEAMPYLTIRYQKQAGGGIVKKIETGALAPTPTSEVQELVVTHTAYVGAEVFAASGYIITDLNV